MVFIRYIRSGRSQYLQHLKLLLILVAVCATPLLLQAQTIQNQEATSNGAGLVSGGNYTGYVSAGQIATYMYANSTHVATQGIILNEIGATVEFTFELSGSLTENQNSVVAQMVLKSTKSELVGTALSEVWIYLVLASDSTVYDSTLTTPAGDFVFNNVPYLDFFFMVGSPIITPETPPVLLAFEENPVFVKEVEIFGEVGVGGEIATTQVVVTPQLTTNTENEADLVYWYRDADGDGHGDANSAVKLNANAQQAGYVDNDTDCDDSRATIYPGAPELCDGLDNDCDGDIDEGIALTFWLDKDGDGYGDPTEWKDTCATPFGYVANNSDCNDNLSSVYPGATELCDGIDNDCDGEVDEDIALSTFWLDADGDGYGNPDVIKDSCDIPVGYVSNNFDCDDSNSSVNPSVEELCDGIDNNCNAEVDEGLAIRFWLDADLDGYGDPGNYKDTCDTPLGYVSNDSDLNDNNLTIYPDAPELCDGLDNDGDGEIDEDLPLTTFWLDEDGDGYGNPDIWKDSCDTPVGYVLNDADCDDVRADVYPGAIEIPGSGIDMNCDGIIDVGCVGLSIIEIYSPFQHIQMDETFDVYAIVEGDLPVSMHWDWGDGTQSDGTYTNGEVTGSHNYTSSGLYEITLTIENVCGEADEKVYAYAVVTDPCAAKLNGLGVYITKGGRGAYPYRVFNYTLFRIKAEYDLSSGSPILDGNFFFYSSSAYIWFRSQSLNWLVVSGSTAYASGTGKYNNQEGYSFIIAVTDSKDIGENIPDKVRIVIMDPNGEIVYDNQAGDPINVQPVQNISPYAVKMEPACDDMVKSAEVGTPENSWDPSGEFEVRAYPNPTKGKLILEIYNSALPEFEVVVNNIAGQKVFQRSYQSTNRVQLNLSNNTAGIYFVNVYSGDQKSLSKIVLQRK